MKALDPKHTAALLFPLLLASQGASADPTTATGPTALALAAVVAPHSPLLSQEEKRVIARLFDGQSNVTPNKKISIKADAIDCRESDVDLTSRSCTLTFGSTSASLSGRSAHEVYATIAEAGVSAEGAAGTLHESLARLACTIDPGEIAQKTGGGADCTWGGQAADLCAGHQMLPTPRPELSCSQLKLQIYRSPDGMLHAVVYPADISLDVTPDMESRVVIRTSEGATLTSQDYSSPRGSNGYYVVNAEWSPDSKFFVYSMSSSGGHSPWSFPMAVYGPEAAHGSRKNVIVGFSDLINGNPTVSADFKFTGPHTVVATTWKQPGSPEQVPVTVDLQQAFDNLPP